MLVALRLTFDERYAAFKKNYSVWDNFWFYGVTALISNVNNFNF